MLRIRWENQGSWIHKPTWEESMALFFDMRKLAKMSDFDQIAGGNYPSEANSLAYQNEAKMVKMPTMKDRLALAVQQAERKLADAKRAQELFDKNPDLEELLNIMQQGHF